MTKQKQTLDMTQLFGFTNVTGNVYIGTPELATRVGAKISDTEPLINPTESTTEIVNFENLVSFTGINFRDSAVASQIGAKIGIEAE